MSYPILKSIRSFHFQGLRSGVKTSYPDLKSQVDHEHFSWDGGGGGLSQEVSESVVIKVCLVSTEWPDIIHGSPQFGYCLELDISSGFDTYKMCEEFFSSCTHLIFRHISFGRTSFAAP